MRTFSRLSDEDKETMLKAPILVAILIAGADGDIDRKEIQEAMRQAKKAQKTSDPELVQLYDEVSTDFEDKLKIVLQSYPVNGTLRNAAISKELATVNALWPKLATEFAANYYKSLCDLARHVAQSSGGVLGLNSIGADEAKYINLPMISNPSGI